MAKTAFTIVLLFLYLSLLCPSTADIKSLTIKSDARPMILFEKFGFTHKGRASVGVSAVSVAIHFSAARLDSSRLGFFLVNEESLPQVLIEIWQNPSFCVLDSHYILRLFTFRDLSPPPLASFNRSYPVTYPGEFSLFFANCAPETSVSMDVVYNLDNDRSNSKDFQ